MKKFTEKLRKQLTCLGENSKTYITFRVPIETEVTGIDKNGEEITKNESYILKFIDSARFMTTTLLNLVNNLSEGFHRIKCKLRHGDKKVKHVELDISLAAVLLNTQI